MFKTSHLQGVSITRDVSPCEAVLPGARAAGSAEEEEECGG